MMFLVLEKRKTIFKVFILKEHRKKKLKNDFSHGKVVFGFEFWDTGLLYCKNCAMVSGIEGRRPEDPRTAFKQTTTMAG